MQKRLEHFVRKYKQYIINSIFFQKYFFLSNMVCFNTVLLNLLLEDG